MQKKKNTIGRCIYEGEEYDFIYGEKCRDESNIIILDFVSGWNITEARILKSHSLYELIKHRNGWYIDIREVQIIHKKKIKRKRLLWNQDTKEKGLTKKN